MSPPFILGIAFCAARVSLAIATKIVALNPMDMVVGCQFCYTLSANKTALKARAHLHSGRNTAQ